MSRVHIAIRAAGAAFAFFACGPLLAAGLCPLEIVGTWRLLDTADTRSTLLSFTADGWANVLNGPGERSAADIAAQVRYRLVPAREPRRIDFEARRGNDVFGAGTTSWEITGYSEDSFTAREPQAAAGSQTVWQRVQTHRYFLTFAARNTSDSGEAAAFVMWTTLDGHRTELDALGSVQRGAVTRFGKIPFDLARGFATQGDVSRDVMMRIEISEAEYRRTRAVHRAWSAEAGRDPRADPNGQASHVADPARRYRRHDSTVGGRASSTRRAGAHASTGERSPPRAGQGIPVALETRRPFLTPALNGARWPPAERAHPSIHAKSSRPEERHGSRRSCPASHRRIR
jgi:hypothetical protein